MNGWDYGSEEQNIKAQTADYRTDQAAIAYKMSLTDRRLDPWFFPYWKTPIESESRYSSAMIDKYKEMFTLLYMCDPAEFDGLYDRLVSEFMLMYGNEVCAERLGVWEKTME